MIAASASSEATSSGSSRWTGPGRSCCARRKASRTSVGMLWTETIWVAILVSGRIVATISTIWNLACRLVRIAFCPVIITIGIAPRSA